MYENPAAHHNGLPLQRRATAGFNAMLLAGSLLAVPPLEVSFGGDKHRHPPITSEPPQDTPLPPLPPCETLPHGNEITSTVSLELPVAMPYALNYDKDPKAKVVNPADVASAVESLHRLEDSGFGKRPIEMKITGHASDEARVNPNGTLNPNSGLGAPSAPNKDLAQARADAVVAELKAVIQAEAITATVTSVKAEESVLAPAEVASLQANAASFNLDLSTAIEMYNASQPLPAPVKKLLDELLGDQRKVSVELTGEQTRVYNQDGAEDCIPTPPGMYPPSTSNEKRTGTNGIRFNLPVAMGGIAIYGKRTAAERTKTYDAISTGPLFGKELVPITRSTELVPFPRGAELVPVTTPGKELVHVPRQSKELVPLPLSARIENPSAYGDRILDSPKPYYEVSLEIVSAAELTSEATTPSRLAIEAAPVRLAIEAAK